MTFIILLSCINLICESVINYYLISHLVINRFLKQFRFTSMQYSHIIPYKYTFQAISVTQRILMRRAMYVCLLVCTLILQLCKICNEF